MRARMMEALRPEYLRRGDEDSGSRDLDSLKPTENFNYDENGLHFVFNEYDIDCYAAGVFDLCIEWPLPESVVFWKRGAGTHELPDDLYIPPIIAPLPFKEDFEYEEDDLPISVSGLHQDAPDAIRFPREKRDKRQSGRSRQDGITTVKEIPAYYEQLNAFIRPKWNAVAPTGINLNVSAWPVVNLTIAKDGRISKATIVSKSGNKAIDAAVDALLADLKVAPVPPLAAEIQIVLENR